MNVREKMVRTFHSLFNAPILEKPQIPNKDRCDLRVSLIQEELNELKEAIENKNLIEIADALCDLQYVLSGTILEFGFKDIFNELFEEVHNSNMSKGCKDIKEAIDTICCYEKRGEMCHWHEKDNMFIVKRNSDEKVLKSINYKKADLKRIIGNDDAIT